MAKPWALTGQRVRRVMPRVSAARYMRTSPLEREWHATMLACGHEPRTAGAEGREAARALFFAVMGYPPPCPASWQQASAMMLSDEARYLSQADLYVDLANHHTMAHFTHAGGRLDQGLTPRDGSSPGHPVFLSRELGRQVPGARRHWSRHAYAQNA